MCVCVCVLSSLYHPSHPPVKSGSQRNQHRSPFAYFHTIWSLKPVSIPASLQDSSIPQARGNACTNIWSATAFLCNKFVFLSVCACSVCMPSCKICRLFSQFDAISPVHLGVRVGCVWGSPWGQVVGTWLQEETLLEKSFQNTPLWEPSIWLTPWSSLLPWKCIPFCTCWGVGDVGQQLESSSSLLIGTWSHGTSWRSHKKINNELQI